MRTQIISWWVPICLTVLLAMSGWTVREVIELKVNVAILATKLDAHIGVKQTSQMVSHEK